MFALKLSRGAASHVALILSITTTTSAPNKEARSPICFDSGSGFCQWVRFPIPLHIRQIKLGDEREGQGGGGAAARADSDTAESAELTAALG